MASISIRVFQNHYLISFTWLPFERCDVNIVSVQWDVRWTKQITISITLSGKLLPLTFWPTMLGDERSSFSDPTTDYPNKGNPFNGAGS